MTTFVHTADWQLGKPFAGVEDIQKRSALQSQRFAVIERIAAVAKEQNAEFVVVAGDLFDSTRPTKAVVSQACSAIGQIGIPVYVIPGNHDHGGPGCIWEQPFFVRERDQLATNLIPLLNAKPVELENAILFPCPLIRRHESVDPTEWLKSQAIAANDPLERPRIVIAHGTIASFGTFDDDDDLDSGTANKIDLEAMVQADFDYIALGDWHGTKRVHPKAWYAGTPEVDRFSRGTGNDPGNIAVVRTRRGELPVVQQVRTAEVGWHVIEFAFAEDSNLIALKSLIADRIGTRANRDLLKLQLTGTIGFECSSELGKLVESLSARLIRLKLDDQTKLAPSNEELRALTERNQDPIIARVASRLYQASKQDTEESAIARLALRELYSACENR